MDDLGGEEVTTIRVINVPSHTTETEFNCWFIFAEGFEQAKLVPTRGSGASQLGWVRFSSVETADYAIQQLNGLQLTEYQSPERNLLSAEFAKQNFRPTQGPASRKRPHAETWSAVQVQPPPPVQTVHVQPPPPARPPPAPMQAAWKNHAAAASTPAPTVSTIFVGGLSHICTEAELHHFFAATFNGYERLKFKPSPEGRAGICWIKFVAPRFAQAAFQTMTDSACYLPSNPGVALTPEWSKNDLDAPRNFEGSGYSQEYIKPPVRVVEVPVPAVVVPRPPPPAVRPPVHAAAPISSTLFVGGLMPACTEEELFEFFSYTFEAFEKLKYMPTSGGKPGVCFVKFASPDYAQVAFQSLAENGYTLPSNPTVTLQPEWAKNDLDAPKRHR